MLQKQKKLLPRVICCYFLAVFIPIVLLSFMIYHYFSDQRIKEYTTDRITSLLMAHGRTEGVPVQPCPAYVKCLQTALPAWYPSAL